MKLTAPCLLALAAVALLDCSRPQEAPAPAWISEKFDLLKGLGIDPNADLVEAASYHWSWNARRELAIGGYRCPTGTLVDVSRSIIVMRAPAPQACHEPNGDAVEMLKVLPDGSAEPLGGRDG